MSTEQHPNINAAGLVVDVVTSIRKYSRNNAERQPLSEEMSDLIVEFCVRVSSLLDKEYGTSIHKQ